MKYRPRLGPGICSRCGKLRDCTEQRYCRSCQNAYKRENRKPLTAEQRFKDSTRSYAGVYKRRGKLLERPCEVCGAVAEMHHDDYSKPLEVKWLCRTHHRELHRVPYEGL